MSRRCQITGKGPSYGNHVSHAKNRVKRRWDANIQHKRIFVPEIGDWVELRVSTRALRTISRKGLLAVLRDQGMVKE